MNKLAIVGLIEPECYDAPFDDPHYDIWTMNGGCGLFRNQRIDLLFDMHDWVKADYVPNYYDWLQKQDYDYPVMKSRPDKALKNVELYPRKEIIAEHGCNFKNTISYMIAYAHYIFYKQVFIYGTNGDEFEQNISMLKSLYEIVGRVRAMGMAVYFVADSQPTRRDMYGYDKLEWGNVFDEDSDTRGFRKK